MGASPFTGDHTPLFLNQWRSPRMLEGCPATAVQGNGWGGLAQCCLLLPAEQSLGGRPRKALARFPRRLKTSVGQLDLHRI